MNQSLPSNQPDRPLLLRVLCILTFMGSGISALSFLMLFLTYSQSIELLKNLAETFPEISPMAGAGKNFFLTGFSLYFISLLGAIMMWNLRKAGFHFYTGAQILLVLLPVVYLHNFPFPVLDAILTVIFIILYSRYLRIMK